MNSIEITEPMAARPIFNPVAPIQTNPIMNKIKNAEKVEIYTISITLKVAPIFVVSKKSNFLKK